GRPGRRAWRAELMGRSRENVAGSPAGSQGVQMKPLNATRPPGLCVGLAVASLQPRMTGPIGQWETPEDWREWVMEEFLNFAAVILAFMGAIHWGLAMRAEEGSEQAPMQLGLSVIPPLLGWFALSLPINFAIPVFFFAFGTLYFADIWAVK